MPASPVSWEDDLDLPDSLDGVLEKRAAVRGKPSGAGGIEAFDFSGSRALVERLRKTAADLQQGESTAASTEPEEPEDDEVEEPEDDEVEEPEDDEVEEPAQIDKVGMASAAVLRQTVSEICDILGGYEDEPVMDKTAGVMALGLAEGHEPEAIVEFMRKEALGPFGPSRDLPEAGMLTGLRRAIYRTPDERLLQARAREARAQAKAQDTVRRLETQQQTLWANQGAATARGDALDRAARISSLEGAGISRPEAEKLLADQAAKAERAAIGRARSAMGIGRNEISLGLGNLSGSVNKRLFTRTMPMIAAPLAVGYWLGRPEKDERPGRSITIS